jgi:hypothetical protein
MANLETVQNPELSSPSSEPELHLLLPKETLEEPLWKSLFQNLDDFFFPKKLPPLVLTSKPEPVRDIWGFYNYKKNGALASTAFHVVAVALLIGGAVVTEIVFNIPGMGRLIISAILRRDYPVVQGVVLVTAASYVLINLAVDMVYAFIDPRIRYD